jgi:hypothetical protein
MLLIEFSLLLDTRYQFSILNSGFRGVKTHCVSSETRALGPTAQ